MLPIVAEMGFTASEYFLARPNHFFCECKLLTVKNKGLPVFFKSRLAVSACFLNSLKAILLVFNLCVVVVDTVIVI